MGASHVAKTRHRQTWRAPSFSAEMSVRARLLHGRRGSRLLMPHDARYIDGGPATRRQLAMRATRGTVAGPGNRDQVSQRVYQFRVTVPSFPHCERGPCFLTWYARSRTANAAPRECDAAAQRTKASVDDKKFAHSLSHLCSLSRSLALSLSPVSLSLAHRGHATIHALTHLCKAPVSTARHLNAHLR